MEETLEQEVDEVWKIIDEFPNYEISNLGNIYNREHHILMRTSINNYGHVKITLTTESGTRYTRAVNLMVAEAFVRPPNAMCDHVIVLDGDFTNTSADNLAWRPKSFSWRYSHQLTSPQPIYHMNLKVRNIDTGVEYQNIISAGMAEGLLFDDIWNSTYSGKGVYPSGHRFEIIERV